MFETEKLKLEKCPFCGGELKKGKIEVTDSKSLFNTASFVNFVPEEDDGKFVKKNAVSLRQNADGYYCDECVQFFGLFDRRY
ncbi:MAG: hypothetical protein J6B28_02315 [Eubacterium sp.]|nr:hypothetical protein [Eubacterium sp.]